MTRRLFVSVLAMAIALMGVTACPAQALSCQMSKQMAGCCDKTTLASGSCCCKHGGSASLPGAGLAESVPSKQILVPLCASQASSASIVSSLTRYLAAHRHAASPPDTPVRLHTILLV